VAFVSGYLVIWVLFGGLAYCLFDLVKAMWIDALLWYRDAKLDARLRRCRDQSTFLAEEWPDGRAGALKMGCCTVRGARAAARR
jgi:predicted metal-binding membrane protein